MAEEGGEQSPAGAPKGSQPVGGVAHIPQPHPRQQATPHLWQDLCAWYGVLEAMPCWVGEEGCAPGGDGVPGLGAPAQPCMALSSWSGRAVAVGPVGEVGSSATWDGEPDTSVYRRRPHPGGSQEWGECPSLSPSPQEPEPRGDQRLLDGGGACCCGGGGGTPLLTGQLLAGPHSLRQGQRSSKSTPLAGFLLGERRG